MEEEEEQEQFFVPWAQYKILGLRTKESTKRLNAVTLII